MNLTGDAFLVRLAIYLLLVDLKFGWTRHVTLSFENPVRRVTLFFASFLLANLAMSKRTLRSGMFSASALSYFAHALAVISGQKQLVWSRCNRPSTNAETVKCPSTFKKQLKERKFEGLLVSSSLCVSLTISLLYDITRASSLMSQETTVSCWYQYCYNIVQWLLISS